jgi:hypothetical protein
MDENPDAVERYSTKLIKYAWRSTWHFSKQQIIFSSILGLIAAPIAYALGLAPSIGMGILAVLIVTAVAFLLAALYNFIRTPALIHYEQQQEIEALRNRAPVPLQPASIAELPPDPEPNLECISVRFDQVEIEPEHDIVQDGVDHIAVITEFVNTPHPERRIGTAHLVFAVIRYLDANNQLVCQVTHGSWLDEDMREVDFGIGDRRRLVLAVQLIDGDEYRPEMDALRAIQNNHENWQRYRAPTYWHLPQNTRRIEVRLCSAVDGSTIGTYLFDLQMGEDCMVHLLGNPA